MQQEEAKEIAREMYGWIQSACGDMAEGDEAAAEDMYDDPDVMEDLLGDAVLDKAKGNMEDMKLILKELLAIHRTGGVRTAIQRLIENH